MARRVPGARLSMEEAALDLYESQGLSATTAAQIAAVAGVTERTFFRHFGDKLEAVFGDETRLRALVADSIVALPPDVPPWEAVRHGLGALAEEFDRRSEALHRRARVIAANPELRERELGRGEAWVGVLTAALDVRSFRGSSEQTTAAVGLALFRVALDRWDREPGRSLVDRLENVYRELTDAVT